MLVQSGIYLDTADLTYGRTAAHWATYYHREDILTELIIAGMCKSMYTFVRACMHTLCLCMCVCVFVCFHVCLHLVSGCVFM